MNKQLTDKLASLPKNPGVYFHKDQTGQIIYIGKAAVLRNRVRQYFQKNHSKDPKTLALVSEIADVDWIEVDTELDALFLEAELIRRYLPRYNILLRDDKSLTYVRISYKDTHPTVSLTRRPLDDKAIYFGPYFSAVTLKKALQYLRKIFPYSTHTGVIPKRVCLQYHLGLCPGLEENKTSLNDYRANLRRLMKYLKGERNKLMIDIEKDMKKAAKRKEFELAAKYRNQLTALKGLANRVVFSDKENLEISKDAALNGLTGILGLSDIPRRIEGYDISHMQGTNNTASMVVFINGIPDKQAYRKFKMRLPGNNDFGHMEETISRRLSDANRKSWQLPDLFLIDGGKGQLSSAIKARDQAGLKIPMIGLAKREEEIVIDLEGSNLAINKEQVTLAKGYIRQNDNFLIISLPDSSPIIKLLQRIRDESHRFAVSYHTVLKIKGQKSSQLDLIPGVGNVTRRRLLKEFGSLKNIANAKQADLQKVIGKSKAEIVSNHLRGNS
jgi:excinuclease ABC subunit C